MADSKIPENKTEASINRAVSAHRKNFDGPHRHVKTIGTTSELPDAAYTVTVGRDPKINEKKAENLTRNKNFTGQQQSILKEIVGDDETVPPKNSKA